MKLREYLRGLRECPDELVEKRNAGVGMKVLPRLIEEFGVYDNYSIFFGEKRERIMENLLKRGFETLRERKLVYRKAVVGFADGIKSIFPDKKICRKGELYITTAKVHPSDFNEESFRTPEDTLREIRGMADAITTIGEYVLEEGIPACFYGNGLYHALLVFNP